MSNEEIALYGSAALPFVFDPEGSPWDVASDLGLVNKRGVESGIIPFILHDSMLGRANDEVFEKIATESFTVGELEFNWLRSEEHTSELQSRFDLVCRLLLEKKNKTTWYKTSKQP